MKRIISSIIILCVLMFSNTLSFQQEKKGSVKPIKKMNPKKQVDESLIKLLSTDEKIYNEGFDTLNKMGNTLFSFKKQILVFVKKNPKSQFLIDGLLNISGREGDNGSAFITDMLLLKEPAIYQSVVRHYGIIQKSDNLQKALLTGLYHRDSSIKKEILDLVGKEKIIEAKNILHEILLSKDETFIRKMAADDIGILGFPDYSTVLSQAYQQEQMVRSPDNTELRLSILQALFKTGGDESLPILINGLGISDEKEQSIKLITSMGEKSLKYLIFALKSKDQTRLDGLLKCLANLEKIASPYMFEFLSSRDPAIQQLALKFFSQVQIPDIIPQVIGLYEKSDIPMKLTILRVFGAYNPTPEVEELLDKAFTAQTNEIKMAVVHAWDNFKDREYVPKYVKIVESEKSPELRIAAINALKHIKAFETIPVLLKIMEKELENVILASIEAISLMDEKGLSLPILTAYSNPKMNEKIREKAKNAMKLITFGKGNVSECASLNTQKTFKKEKEKKNITGEESGIKYIVHGKGKLGLFVIPGGPDYGLFSIYPYYDDFDDDMKVTYLLPEIRNKSETVDIYNTEIDAMEKIRVNIGAESVFLICHDIAVFPCLKYYNKYPARIRAFVFINPPYPSKSALSEYEKSVLIKLEEPFKTEFLKLINEQERFSNEALTFYYYRLLMPALITKNESPGKISCFLGGNVSGREQYVSGLSDEDETIKKIVQGIVKRKALIIFTDGSFSPKNQMEEFKKMATVTKDKPQSQLIFSSVSSCGHLPQITCQSKLIDIIEDFLKKELKK